MLRESFRSLDRILRGEITSPEAIEREGLRISLRGFTLVGIVLAFVYGICMGSFSIFRESVPNVGTPNDRYLQVLASAVKVPALFFLTLLVTTPSLYVFNALMGSRLRLSAMLRLLMASMGVNLAVLASLGPIVAFFSVSTPSYAFIVLFHVVVFGVSGLFGLLFLVQTLNRLTLAGDVSSPTMETYQTVTPVEATIVDNASTPMPTSDASPIASPAEAEGDERDSTTVTSSLGPGPRPAVIDAIPGQPLGPHVQLVFRCWLILFGLVGAQMGWVLRPFIGNPESPFTWFRERESNFFEAIAHTLGRLIGLLP